MKDATTREQNDPINEEKRVVGDIETNAQEPGDKMHDLPPISMAKIAPLLVVLVGTDLLNTASLQAMVIALPTIGSALDIPEGRYQWMLSAYNLTFGCFLLIGGKLADLYGRPLIFLMGGIWVSATCLGTAFTRSEAVFDFLRGLQGIGAAANIPAAIGILGATIPPGRVKNIAFALYGAGGPLGSILGNLFGGILTQYASWQWIFYSTAIFSSCTTLAAFFVLPRPLMPPASSRTKKLTLDWIGSILITGGLIVLVFALSEGNIGSNGWQRPYIPALIATSIVMITAFVAWEWYVENKTQLEPLMQLSIFKNKKFSISMVITAFFWATFGNYLVYTTYFYQNYQGLSAIQTTLRFIPTGVVGLFITVVVGHILSHIAIQHILVVGLSAMSISTLLFFVPIPPSTSYFAYGMWAMGLAVLGADTVYPCLTLYTTSSLPLKDQSLGAGIFNTVSQVGRAIGLVVVSAADAATREGGGNKLGWVGVKSNQTEEQGVLLSGLRLSQGINFGFSLVALITTVVGLRGLGKIAKISGDDERRDE